MSLLDDMQQPALQNGKMGAVVRWGGMALTRVGFKQPGPIGAKSQLLEDLGMFLFGPDADMAAKCVSCIQSKTRSCSPIIFIRLNNWISFYQLPTHSI